MWLSYRDRRMVALGRDLRHATRTLLKSPLFALIAVLVLGLALAANLTAFTWVNALFLRPLPVDEPDELMQVWTTDASGQPQGTFIKAIDVLREEPSFGARAGSSRSRTRPRLAAACAPLRARQ
jgi:hypothetical protein